MNKGNLNLLRSTELYKLQCLYCGTVAKENETTSVQLWMHWKDWLTREDTPGMYTKDKPSTRYTASTKSSIATDNSSNDVSLDLRTRMRTKLLPLDDYIVSNVRPLPKRMLLFVHNTVMLLHGSYHNTRIRTCLRSSNQGGSNTHNVVPHSTSYI